MGHGAWPEVCVDVLIVLDGVSFQGSACLRRGAPSVSLAFVLLSALALQRPPLQLLHLHLLGHTAHILQSPACTQPPLHLWETLPDPQQRSLIVGFPR